MIGFLSGKPAVKKVISFFDFDTTISIRLFLGLYKYYQTFKVHTIVPNKVPLRNLGEPKSPNGQGNRHSGLNLTQSIT